MKMILLTILLTLVACGRKEPDVDPELQGYLDQYLAVAPNEGRLDTVISIQFGEVPDGKNGKCYHDTYGVDHVYTEYERRIVIATDLKKYKGTLAKVAYHELGHCLHGFDHSDDKKSIMYKSSTKKANEYWEKNAESALREMFK